MTIEEAIEILSEAKQHHLDLGKRLSGAYDGAIYAMDLLAVAVLNRSLYLIEGISLVILDRNYISAVPLLRLQMDNVLRFFAATLVEDTHQFASDVMAGKHVRKLKDSKGSRMTDKYLVEKLSIEYEWVEKVYKKGSGYVHLSDEHIKNTVHQLENEKEFLIQIGRGQVPIPDEMFLDLIGAFIETTKLILKYIDNWIFTKDNPHLAKNAKD